MKIGGSKAKPVYIYPMDSTQEELARIKEELTGLHEQLAGINKQFQNFNAILTKVVKVYSGI